MGNRRGLGVLQKYVNAPPASILGSAEKEEVMAAVGHKILRRNRVGWQRSL